MSKLRIIVGGFLGIIPAGGVTWDYVQYPLGFALLGHDVYYIEDTKLYPIYQQTGSKWNDASSCVQHLEKVMNYFGLKDRWAYRDEASGNCFGLSSEKIKEVCKSADVFINISCSTFLRDEYMQIPVRILVDSDPMFTQIQYASSEKFTEGTTHLREMLDGHNHLFTFGENIGQPDCRIPLCGLTWHTTRQPVCLNYWPQKKAAATTAGFTTLMNWTAGKKLQYEGETWGQKDVEFNKIVTMPKVMSSLNFSLVVNQSAGMDQAFSHNDLQQAGWKLPDPETNAGNWLSYQDFINGSKAEFSVAKETYVKARTGWFSCRSACYLAAGRPVITQDTGWSKYITSGKGVFAFTDMQSATAAIKEVVADYHFHSKQARQIAADYFDSNQVLKEMLDKIN